MSNKKFIDGTELVQAGFANGISTQLAEKQLLDATELQMALERAIAPHYQLAQNMGFKSGWLPA